MPIPNEKEPNIRTTARERVYKTLREWIVTGTLLPEERLNDVEIANYFSVSRTPVREALQMLSEQKLVTMVPSSGTFVSSIDQKDMCYVYELLGGLQCYAVEQGISRITDEDLTVLRQTNETFYHYAECCDAVEAIKADRKFHHRIAELAGNPYLINFTEQLMLQAHRNEFRFFRENVHSERSYETHKRIVAALEKKDVRTAKILVQQNWRVSIENDETK